MQSCRRQPLALRRSRACIPLHVFLCGSPLRSSAWSTASSDSTAAMPVTMRMRSCARTGRSTAQHTGPQPETEEDTAGSRFWWPRQNKNVFGILRAKLARLMQDGTRIHNGPPIHCGPSDGLKFPPASSSLTCDATHTHTGKAHQQAGSSNILEGLARFMARTCISRSQAHAPIRRNAVGHH